MLTPAQRQQFEDEGYVVVDGVLDPARDIQPVMDEFGRVLDGVAEELFRPSAKTMEGDHHQGDRIGRGRLCHRERSFERLAEVNRRNLHDRAEPLVVAAGEGEDGVQSARPVSHQALPRKRRRRDATVLRLMPPLNVSGEALSALITAIHAFQPESK